MTRRRGASAEEETPPVPPASEAGRIKDGPTARARRAAAAQNAGTAADGEGEGTTES